MANRCMVKRSEYGVLGAAWLQGHLLSVGPEALGRSSRVRRAALGHQMLPEEPVVARHGVDTAPPERHFGHAGARAAGRR